MASFNLATAAAVCGILLTGPAAAWQSVMLDDFVPGASLVILGDGINRQETITVSCVVDHETGDIRKLFVDVSFAASPPEGPALLSFDANGSKTEFVTAYAPRAARPSLVTVHGEQEPERSRMFAWIKDATHGATIVTVAVAGNVVSTFTVSGDGDAEAVPTFLDNCTAREHR